MAIPNRHDAVRWHLVSFIILSFLLFICTNAQTTNSPESLRLVNILYRHGDRSPTGTFPNDIVSEKEWPQGFGQLSIMGMRQQYALGRFLRNRYSGFLSPNYTRTEIYVRSTDVDRTLMSAAANLAGLFPPEGNQVWNRSIPWQPVPIHTVPESDDYLLRMDGHCPRYKQLLEERMQSDPVQKIYIKYKVFFKQLAKDAGLPNITFENIWSVSDPVYCEKVHHFILPPWVTDNVYEQMKYLSDITFYLNYCGQEISKLKGGSLLGQIVKSMINKRNNKGEGEKLKMIVYSAHDITITALQCALNLFNNITPPYASAMFVELHEAPLGNYYVKMFYRNNSKKPLIPLKLEDCDENCSLVDFIELTKKSIPYDLKKECEWQPGLKFELFIWISVIATIFAIIIIIFVISFIKCRGNKYKFYQALKPPLSELEQSLTTL